MQSYDEEDKTKEKMWSMIWDLHHFFLMSVSMVRIEEECKSAVPYEQDCSYAWLRTTRSALGFFLVGLYIHSWHVFLMLKDFVFPTV